MRFAFRMGRLSRMVLAPLGVSASSGVELGAHGVRVRFGRLFDQQIAYDAVESATCETWPLIGGIGLRIGTGSALGLVSAVGPVVRVRLLAPLRVPLAFGLAKSVRALVVSVDAPEALVAALETRIGR